EVDGITYIPTKNPYVVLRVIHDQHGRENYWVVAEVTDKDTVQRVLDEYENMVLDCCEETAQPDPKIEVIKTPQNGLLENRILQRTLIKTLK
ncbi:unnamed protein product, partial [marine sediment metagenome]